SAMVDGELDPAGVRRVMIHSDLCASCREFLDGIRSQARIHKHVAAAMATVGAGDVANGVAHPELARLRDRLTANRKKLAKVLYELGRGFVLMGLSADFSREVAKEPVPVPDVAQRGRNLLDEVARSAGHAGDDWIVAKDLFDGQLRTKEENLARGQRLLSECSTLEPGLHEARIYLGLVHHVRGQRALARKQFLFVLEHCDDRLMRGYALSNLGNIHLDEGDWDGAVRVLLQLVESGVMGEQPRMITAFFNLAIAYGLKGQFQDCLHWFTRLHRELPHKRNLVGRELARRSHFLHLVQSHPEARPLCQALTALFPVQAEVG
ncbi:MAG: tetratricopeptide repeat protein, partial [Planctomycetes bacterium]|nr:tetratricopeptide repeat protein [Planctomycetota bacterium]